MLVALAVAAVVQAVPATDRVVATQHVMVDDAGKAWQSADLAKLADWIARRNREIATGKTAPKIPAPVSGPKIPAGVKALNYGVDHSRIPKAREWYGGTAPVGKSIQSSPITDRMHVTVIGPDATVAVESWRRDPEFRRLEAAMGDRLAVQAFDDPQNPLVADVGLPAGGRPDVVIQMASGKVVYRRGSDPGASVIVGEIRKRDPAYDPGRDPSGVVSTPDVGRLAAWAGVGIVALLLLRGGRK